MLRRIMLYCRVVLSLTVLNLLFACGTSSVTKDGIHAKTNLKNLSQAAALDDTVGLGFPFKDPHYVVETHCFGIHPWSSDGERHGGIDIVPAYKDMSPHETRTYKAIAVADGVVDRIVYGTTGAGADSLIVLLKLNAYWYALYVFEPQTRNETVFIEQVNGMIAKAGQRLRKGDLIGELAVGSLMHERYPHIHFGFFYKNPADTIESLFTNYLNIAVSDGSDLAPYQGAGSPWEAKDLNRKITLFCPYAYSSQRAKAFYDSYPKIAGNGILCRSVCAYNSKNSSCGSH